MCVCVCVSREGIYIYIYIFARVMFRALDRLGSVANVDFCGKYKCDCAT